MHQPNKLAPLAKATILRRKSDIQLIYEKGTSILHYPIKATIILQETEETETTQVIFFVNKKYHKHAVDRNIIRRRIKEAFRLRRAEFNANLAQQNVTAKIALSYISNDILNYKTIENAIDKIFENIADMAIPNAD